MAPKKKAAPAPEPELEEVEGPIPSDTPVHLYYDVVVSGPEARAMGKTNRDSIAALAVSLGERPGQPDEDEEE